MVRLPDICGCDFLLSSLLFLLEQKYRAQVLANHIVFRLVFLGGDSMFLFPPGRMLGRYVDRLSMGE